MPSRSDLEPTELRKVLPFLILIDVVSDARRYVYRLVGTHEVELRGRDPTGKSVAEAYYGEDPGETMRYLDRVVATRAPVLYRGTYRPNEDASVTEDVIFLPLSADDESVNMILICGHVVDIEDQSLINRYRRALIASAERSLRQKQMDLELAMRS